LRTINFLIIFIALLRQLFAQNWVVIDFSDFSSWTYGPESFAVANPGDLWIGNTWESDFLLHYQDANILSHDAADYPGFPTNSIRDIAVDNTGNVWFNSYTYNNAEIMGGIVRYDGSNFSFFDTSNTTLPSNLVDNISVDNSNNVWFVRSETLTKFDGSVWQTTDYSNQLNSAFKFREVEFDSDNNKWIPSLGGILKITTDNTIIEYNEGNTDLISNFSLDLEIDNENFIWVAQGSDGVIRASYDFLNIISWDTTDLQVSDITNIEIDQSGTIWVGGRNGVASYDGSNWKKYDNSDLPLVLDDVGGTFLMDIQVDENNNKYFLTHNGGILIYNENIVNDVSDVEEISKDFLLSQNFPNPFNPSTTISYSIPKQSNVSLKVYDMLGREIAELVDAEKSAGSYKVNFDAGNLSSGIYFYTLKANEFSSTRKMLLIK